MNKNEKRKSNGNGQNLATVRVEFNQTNARAVAIAGSFNNWRPEVTQMVSVGNGRWIKELVLPSGTYEYLLVVDGKWLPDPAATESVPNPFGGMNSVMTVRSNGGVAPEGKS